MSVNRNYEIVKNKQIAPDYFLMEINASEIAQKGIPGQFVHVKVTEDSKTYDPLLRRPFSFYDIDKKQGIIKLVYELVGKGTKILTKFSSGDSINILGPLGNGFNINHSHKKPILIGGGMGIVPLYYLARELIKNDLEITMMIGGNKEENIKFFIKQLEKLDLNLHIATIDGSRGYKGTVLDLWKENNDKFQKKDYIYSCGPEAMLSEIKKYAGNLNIKGEFSLEARMGCGIGVCLSCVCKTVDGNQRVCKEGPVFALNEVIFDE